MWLDDIRPRAGRTVPLKVLTRSYRGEEKISTLPIEIPANAPRELTVLVTDGRQLNAMEQRELRGSLQPQSVAQMIRVLNETRRNNRIYVRLLTGRAGAVVNGEAMTALPPSVLSVLEARSQRRQLHARSAAPRSANGRFPTDAAVTGSRDAHDRPRGPVAAHDARALPDASWRSSVRFACLLGVALVAATPTFWTVSSQADFLKGDVEDLSIDSDGRMFLGPAASVLGETSAPFLWTIVAGADGTLWAGSGNEGKVLKIAQDGKVTTFFDAPELEVHAIAPAPQRRPLRRHLAGRQDLLGRRRRHVEDVLRSGRQVHLGARGRYVRQRLRRHRRQGRHLQDHARRQGRALLQDRAPPTSCRSRSTRTGELIAGTESPGRVFRIDAAGKAFVLLDSPFREIHALRLAADGTIYAAARERARRRPEPIAPPSPLAEPSRRRSLRRSRRRSPACRSWKARSPRAPRRPPAARTRRRRAAARSTASGPTASGTRSGRPADDAPYDLDRRGRRQPAGRHRARRARSSGCRGDPARATLLARAAARQVTALLREPSGRIVGATSNPGKVFALSSAAARRGTYESDVRDAGTVATWGAIRWRASRRAGQVQIVTRSGNTATPDETWSAWSKAYTNAEGERDRQPERALSAVARDADERQRARARC